MKRSKLGSLLILFGLFLIALAIRGVYFFELSKLPYFDTVLPVYDHSNFDLGAMNFAEGDWLARSPNNSYSLFINISWVLSIFFLDVIFLWFTACSLRWEP